MQPWENRLLEFASSKQTGNLQGFDRMLFPFENRTHAIWGDVIFRFLADKLPS